MAPKTETTPAEPKLCKCGCGATVKSSFAQGHDMRLISQLAENVVNGKPPTANGALSQAKAKRPVNERIELVAAMLTDRVSEAISAKFENAANRKVAQNTAKAERAAAKPAKAATKAKPRTKATAKTAVASAPVTAVAEDATPDPEPADDSNVAKRGIGPAAGDGLALGAPIVIQVRGRKVNATVHGMNQAGKVTMAVYSGAKGAERQVPNPVIVNPAPDAAE